MEREEERDVEIKGVSNIYHDAIKKCRHAPLNMTYIPILLRIQICICMYGYTVCVRHNKLLILRYIICFRNNIIFAILN